MEILQSLTNTELAKLNNCSISTIKRYKTLYCAKYAIQIIVIYKSRESGKTWKQATLIQAI